jgi:hypothetical protein
MILQYHWAHSAPEIGTDSEYNVLLSIFLKTGLGCMGEESSGGPGVEFEKNKRIGR